jgi:hypothetical protein
MEWACATVAPLADSSKPDRQRGPILYDLLLPERGRLVCKALLVFGAGSRLTRT